MSEAEGPPSVTFASGGLSWTRVRTPRLLSRIGKAFFLVGALGALSMVLPSLAFLGLGGMLGVLAWPLFIVSYILSLTQTVFGGGLEVSKDELVVVTGTKRAAFPIAKLAGALVVVEREAFGSFGTRVEIELKSGDVLTARFADPRSAEAVVRALGFGPGGRRVHARLAKPTRRLLHPLLGVASYTAGLTATMLLSSIGRSGGDTFEVGFAFYPLVSLLIYAALRRVVRAPEVTVGDDGVVVKRVFRDELIARRDIALASAATGSALVIEQRSGKRAVIRGVALDAARLAAVARVLEERAAPLAQAADRFAHYERAGRALAEWREHLARAMNEASYRQNAATVDEAASVLRSAQATAEQRVGAALALRMAGQPPERIRIAVDAAVDDRVREALEAVAEAEEDVVIEKALRRMQP